MRKTKRPTKRQIESLERIIFRLEAWQKTVDQDSAYYAGVAKDRLLDELRRMIELNSQKEVQP